MFDNLIQTATEIKPLVDFVGGLGLVTVFGVILLSILKRNAELRQWRNFKNDLGNWAEAMLSKHGRHPKQLTDNDWRSQCESMLHDAQYTPTEIAQILDLAIIVAKASTLDILDIRDR